MTTTQYVQFSPVGSIQESLTHTLPPLDDLSAEEEAELAHMSILGDGGLWQISAAKLSDEQQATLETLLLAQSAEQLSVS